MGENRFQAFERIRRRFGENDGDPFTSSYGPRDSVVDDACAALRPFLLSPERHAPHARIIMEFCVEQSILQSMAPIFQLYRLALVRNLPPFSRVRDLLLRHRAEFRRAVQMRQDELKRSLEPADLQLDVLPLRSGPTHDEWAKEGKRLVLIEAKALVTPTDGMDLQSVSMKLNVVTPARCQFIEATPANSMETVGKSETTIAERGRSLQQSSQENEVALELGTGAAKLSPLGKETASRETEAETSGSHKVMKVELLKKVTSSAIRETAQWELLRTPTQDLLGENRFFASVLIPRDAPEIVLRVELGAHFANWDAVNKSESFTLRIPTEEARK